MTHLDTKINQHFPGLVVRKDLVKLVKGNAIVPSYVLEYLLGQYCATNDEASIQAGIETVKEILRRHYVHRNEAGLIRSTIKEKGRHKVIDKISVNLNEKTDTYEATFANLGIKRVLIDSNTVRSHPKLLVSGVWCIADLEYEYVEDRNISPYVLDTLKPIQVSHFDFDGYIETRQNFSTEEWIDLLIQSIGFDPAYFGRRGKLLQLVRLVPFCERNYNLVELGPKGTGKSHIYSEFSPHAILISGGEVTVPKLFVNNATGKIGLVGYWDVVAFDEFSGRKKSVNKALVDIMKNYMANKSFSRGIETIGAEASMVFIGNTQHTVPYMLRHTDLFDELPDKYHDSAFLDRIHFYVPGWEVDIIRNQIFSEGYGFVVDYLAEILRSMRDMDYTNQFQDQFTLTSNISTRDRTGITKTFSGLMKILYPHRQATADEIREILEFAMEGRKRVKDQLLRIDSTYADVNFTYTDSSGTDIPVKTLEEEQYPKYYHQSAADTATESSPLDTAKSKLDDDEDQLEPRHLVVKENQRGISFDELFGPYLAGADTITVTDPYIRMFHQVKNFMELLETIAKFKLEGEPVSVHLVTGEDEGVSNNSSDRQEEYLERIQESCQRVDIHFTWEIDQSQTIHARHIVTNTGWKISLDRGLDVFQYYDVNDLLSFTTRLQQYRSCKAFEMTILRHEPVVD